MVENLEPRWESDEASQGRCPCHWLQDGSDLRVTCFLGALQTTHTRWSARLRRLLPPGRAQSRSSTAELLLPHLGGPGQRSLHHHTLLDLQLTPPVRAGNLQPEQREPETWNPGQPAAGHLPLTSLTALAWGVYGSCTCCRHCWPCWGNVIISATGKRGAQSPPGGGNDPCPALFLSLLQAH